MLIIIKDYSLSLPRKIKITMNSKRLIPLFFAVLIAPFFTRAQVTTSSITGVVKDKGGNNLPGLLSQLHMCRQVQFILQ